jgi:hypothetical protein
VSFSGSDTESLSKLTGNQQDTNYYDPDRAYTQQLMAYEMYGPQGVTGSQYNPFNLGPATNKSDYHDWEAAPNDWARGSGWVPDSPLTPVDRLPPPYTGGDGGQSWNPGQGKWDDPPSGGGDPGGGGGGGGNEPPDRPLTRFPTVDPTGRTTRTLPFRPLSDYQPQQHIGDPGTATNPIEAHDRGWDPIVGGPPKPPAESAEEGRLRRIAAMQGNQAQPGNPGRPA